MPGVMPKGPIINISSPDSEAVARNEFLVASVKVESYHDDGNMKILGSLSSVIRSENQWKFRSQKRIDGKVACRSAIIIIKVELGL